MPRAFKAMLVVFAVIVGTLLLWLAKPAHAQNLCGQYENIKKALDDKYQERRRYMGVGGGLILEVYVSSKETFTILVVKPNRFTCVIAGGEGWTELEPEIIGEKKL